MRGALTAFILLTLAASSGGAADYRLTEESATALAVEKNLALASSRVLLESKRIVSDTAMGVFVPGLTANGGLSRANQETSVPAPGTPYHWTGTLGITASVAVSAASIQGVRTARLDYQAGRISLEEAQNAITLQVRKSFYQLILLENQLTVSKASIATAEQTLEQVRTDYANGRVQRLTVRQAELSLQSARLLLQRQMVQYDNALASFKNVLGIAPTAAVELDGSLEISPVSVADGVSDASVEQRVDVRGIEAQIALQRSKERASYLSLISPTLTVSASISPSFPDPFSSNNPPGSTWNDRGSVSVSLSAGSLLGFLPFVPQNVNLQMTRKTIESLEIQLQETAASARTEIESLVRSLEASSAAIDSLKASVSLAQESYDLTREAYGLGTADFLTLKSAEDDLLKARYDVLSEEYTYLSSLISLEYATGMSFRGSKE